MFSDVGQSLDQDTVEYAWLVEVQLGKLCGKLTTPQLYSILACLETLILLISDEENELSSPKEAITLSQPVTKKKATQISQNVHVQQVQQAIQHLLQPKNTLNTATKAAQAASNINNVQKLHPKLEKRKEDDKKGSIKSSTAPITTEDSDLLNEHKLKYRLCRVAIDAVDFWLVENGAALQLWVRSFISIYSLSLTSISWYNRLPFIRNLWDLTHFGIIKNLDKREVKII